MSKSEFKGARYITVSVDALKAVKLLSKSDPSLKSKFFDTIYSMFKELTESGKISIEKTDDDDINEIMQNLADEMDKGYQLYMKKVNNRKKENAISDRSAVDQRSISEGSVADLIDKNQINNQIKSQSNKKDTISSSSSEARDDDRLMMTDKMGTVFDNLEKRGYTKTQIQNAMAKLKPDQKISNLTNYLAKIIEQDKTSGTMYEQRDYTGEEESIDDLMERLNKAK